MKKPFEGEYLLTQTFGNVLIIGGVNIYAQFGLKGHNGLDWGIPTGTKILAPHDGKIIEATLDPKGYGIYCKIENAKEGSVLAHFKELRVGVGDSVYEGQFVALSNNSGNSTGPHLHWGYYRLPRDRNNGYNGFIDQTDYLKQSNSDDTIAELENEIDGLKAQIITHENFQKSVSSTLNIPNQPTDILGQITKLLAEEDQLRKILEENKQLVSNNKSCEEELAKTTDQYFASETALKALQGQYSYSQDIIKTLGDKYEECVVSLKFKVLAKIMKYYICIKE